MERFQVWISLVADLLVAIATKPHWLCFIWRLDWPEGALANSVADLAAQSYSHHRCNERQSLRPFSLVYELVVPVLILHLNRRLWCHFESSSRAMMPYARNYRRPGRNKRHSGYVMTRKFLHLHLHPQSHLWLNLFGFPCPSSLCSCCQVVSK